MTLKVVGAGFGRTGTLSMKYALDQLGFGPTHHMDEVLRHPAQVRGWHTYGSTGEADWDELFAGYGAAVDFPGSCVWRGLADHCPDAKVVLTVRDPDSWWESTHSTIYQARRMFPQWMLRLVPQARLIHQMLELLIWDGIFDGRFEDRDHAVAVFRAHIAEVERTIPPERLLVFEVAQGWGPLCEFLGVPVPDGPFPRLNDMVAWRRRMRVVHTATRVPPVAAGAAAAALVGRIVVRRARASGRIAVAT